MLSTVACSGGGGGGGDEGPQCTTAADCDAGESCVDQVCVPDTAAAECDKAANVAKREALLAISQKLAVKPSSGKTLKTYAGTFASVAGDPSVQCEVQLQYRDLSGDGTLQPYEDFTKSPEQRAEDLVGRMTKAQKLALMAHATLSDVPTTSSTSPSAVAQAIVDAGIRFGATSANGAAVTPRATWANAIQERAEASAWGIPFVLSSEPAHMTGNGRVKAKGFSQWPNELGLGATGDLALVQKFGQIVAKEYRAIGVTMALGVSADLATDPRWQGSQFTFGEDSAAVSAMVGAYVKGLQGAALDASGVAAVVGQFPGAGAAKGGFDARLAKGKFTSYPGNAFDGQVRPFETAVDAGVAGVTPGYGIPETGAWTGLAGVVNGASIEQVGASFNAKLLTDVLRGHYGFGGLVIAPPGVLENAGVAPLGAPWGLESATKAERIAKAVQAGVDQFRGLNDTTALAAAALTDAQIDAAAKRALAVAFRLGLFENPYVDAARAPALCNTDAAYQAGLDAMNRGMVLLLNKAKPSGWLNGTGDGTQRSDKGNAGNGTLKVLPAPPGEPYVAAGCDYFVAGDFDLDYVNSVSAGYGNMTNAAPNVKGVTIDTTVADGGAAQRMALSDYVFVRIAAPYTADPDSGAFQLPLPSLDYAGNDPSVLAPVEAARAAIASWTGTPASRAQIVVVVDAGRPSVMSELLDPALGISGLYLQWAGTLPSNAYADKVALDVAFGIVDGAGKLPVGLPASDDAAAAQREDVAGDGQDAALVKGFGISTAKF
ncbi:MAG TPA: glycoside hydrolase family 3 N-terminal domain-containing protein [Anaeromyxobacteraceae bacterium]|nr:glycoside hydrolase family 3 N-terminal domain-containing protein [Anaeromyxobacteraceae bacterium]